MIIISEDTPAGGQEELQWQIDNLLAQLERNKAELERHLRKGLPMTHEELETELVNMFEGAITDNWEREWEFVDAARACVAALFAEPELLNALADAVIEARED